MSSAIEITRCTVCEGLIDPEDLFCCNCGTEAPLRITTDRETVEHAESRTSTFNFTCGGCGASMSYDASAQNLRCPFCGAERLERHADSQEIAPWRVIEFQLSQNEALIQMRAELSRGFWRPSDLSERAMVVKTVGVYVPYWVFRAGTHTYWTADSSKTPFGAKSSWYPLTGEVDGEVRGLLVGASGALTPGETNALSPFDLAPGRPPEEVDLENITVEQFGMTRKNARPLAMQGLEQMQRETCQTQVPGKCRNLKVNVLARGMSSEPVLLPVWIMAYRYQEEVYRFLVNGQTGKCTGSAPFSYRKLAGVIAAVVGAVFFVALLIILVAAMNG